MTAIEMIEELKRLPPTTELVLFNTESGFTEECVGVVPLNPLNQEQAVLV